MPAPKRAPELSMTTRDAPPPPAPTPTEPDRPQPRRARGAAGRAGRAGAGRGDAGAPAVALAVSPGRHDPATMTTLPEGLRERLAAGYDIARPALVAEQVSADGTRKWLLRFADGQEVETVYIPEAGRGALCISTQVGCSLTCASAIPARCRWCATCAQTRSSASCWSRATRSGEWPTPAGARRLSHLVVMGMGEPLLNYEQTARALRSRWTPTASPSRGARSRSRPRVRAQDRGLGRELGVGLAISLHAVRDELRDQLVPINRKWNIAALLEACRAMPPGSDRPHHLRVCDAGLASTTATPTPGSWCA